MSISPSFLCPKRWGHNVYCSLNSNLQNINFIIWCSITSLDGWTMNSDSMTVMSTWATVKLSSLNIIWHGGCVCLTNKVTHNFYNYYIEFGMVWHWPITTLLATYAIIKTLRNLICRGSYDLGQNRKTFGTYLGCCKLENEILKEAKNREKWPKMIISRPKNVIFERFWPLSKFHFPACSTLNITFKFGWPICNIHDRLS